MKASLITAARQRVTDAGVVHTLHPGELACADQGDRLETLLGSCVAIILTDPRRTIGVMSHIVHSRPAVGMNRQTGAHADAALEAMYGLLLSRGISPLRCEAFVYGGGNMFPGLYRHSHVGDDNARWALAALEEDGIRVLQHDLGGTTYRRLAWTIGPGDPEVTAVAV